MRWQLPANVSSVVTIPLWGRPPPVPWRARLSRGRNDAVLSELIDVLLRPPAEAPDRFTGVMRELFSYAQGRNLPALLAGETAVRLLSEAWRQRWPQILPEPDAARRAGRAHPGGTRSPPCSFSSTRCARCRTPRCRRTWCMRRPTGWAPCPRSRPSGGTGRR